MTHKTHTAADAPEELDGLEAAAQLLKVVYLTQPDDHNFRALVDCVGEDTERLVDYIWQAKPLQIKHLTWALYFAKRGLEASFFAEKWCASEPDNAEAWKVASLLACEQAMPSTAQKSINEFSARNPNSQTSFALACAYALVFNMPSNALKYARLLCETHEDLEPLSISVCFDTAVRFEDPNLSLELCLRGYSRGQRVESKRYKLLTRILRQRLVSTIARCSHDPELQRCLDDVTRGYVHAQALSYWGCRISSPDHRFTSGTRGT